MYTTSHLSESAVSTTMTIRLDEELKQRLDRLAKATDRSKSYLAAEALRDYVAINEWQVQEIQAAVAEADAGDYATDEELVDVLSRWGVGED